MAKIVATNRTDTLVEGVPSLSMARAVLNYAADYAVKSDSSNEVILTNLTAPLDAPERFRFAVSEIKDVYKNTGIDPTKQSASRRGVNLLAQLTGVYTVTDDTDALFKEVLPLEGHIVLKIPASEYITGDMLIAFIGRLVSGLFATGSSTDARLKSMVRGSLTPADI